VRCERCLETVDASALDCPDHACPVQAAVGGGFGDEAVAADLARANLLRIRDQYDEARDLCLQVLKRHPGNLAGHTLLGDLHAEQDRLAEAAEWYELALDIDPSSTANRNKLERVRARLEEHEAANAAHLLGIPTKASHVRLFTVLVAAFVVLVGVGAFLLGKARVEERVQAPTRVETVDVGKQATPAPSTTVPIEREAPPPPLPPVADDAAALKRAQENCEDGSRIVAAAIDPRTREVSLTYEIQAGENPRTLAEKLGVSALAVFPEAPRVIWRAVRDGRLLYLADLRRAVPDPASAPADAPPAPLAIENEWSATN
jgi:tetratricopeptide (TPR) repeat protein